MSRGIPIEIPQDEYCTKDGIRHPADLASPVNSEAALLAAATVAALLSLVVLKNNEFLQGQEHEKEHA